MIHAPEVANQFHMDSNVPKLALQVEEKVEASLSGSVLKYMFVFIVMVAIALQYVQAYIFRSEFHTKSNQLMVEISKTQALVGTGNNEKVIFLKILYLKPNIDLELARTIASAVLKGSRSFNRDSDFILAIMAHESDFNPKAVSSAGAVGLMQVLSQWVGIIGEEEDLTIPEVSVRRGLQIYTFYEREFGNDKEKALTAYNRGTGPVWGDMVAGREWRNGYAAKVLETYEKLKSLSQGH